MISMGKPHGFFDASSRALFAVAGRAVGHRPGVAMTDTFAAFSPAWMSDASGAVAAIHGERLRSNSLGAVSGQRLGVTAFALCVIYAGTFIAVSPQTRHAAGPDRLEAAIDPEKWDFIGAPEATPTETGEAAERAVLAPIPVPGFAMPVPSNGGGENRVPPETGRRAAAVAALRKATQAVLGHANPLSLALPETPTVGNAAPTFAATLLKTAPIIVAALPSFGESQVVLTSQEVADLAFATDAKDLWPEDTRSHRHRRGAQAGLGHRAKGLFSKGLHLPVIDWKALSF
jgi:hypothetical protein